MNQSIEAIYGLRRGRDDPSPTPPHILFPSKGFARRPATGRLRISPHPNFPQVFHVNSRPTDANEASLRPVFNLYPLPTDCTLHSQPCLRSEMLACICRSPRRVLYVGRSRSYMCSHFVYVNIHNVKRSQKHRWGIMPRATCSETPVLEH